MADLEVAESQDPPPLDAAVWRVARVAIFGSLLSTLDATIVNVSLRTMQQSLATDLATVQWGGAGYLLALALALPLSGWLVERLGASRLYLGCLLGFTATSALCGLAPHDRGADHVPAAAGRDRGAARPARADPGHPSRRTGTAGAGYEHRRAAHPARPDPRTHCGRASRQPRLLAMGCSWSTSPSECSGLG